MLALPGLPEDGADDAGNNDHDDDDNDDAEADAPVVAAGAAGAAVAGHVPLVDNFSFLDSPLLVPFAPKTDVPTWLMANKSVHSPAHAK